MKLTYKTLALMLSLIAFSCSVDNEDPIQPIIDEVADLIKIQDIDNGIHTIEIYSESGTLITGYNNISLRIKNNTTDSYYENFVITWNPMMQMTTMQHSCPKSLVTKNQNKNTIYEGFIIYQMTNSDGSGWSLTFDYTIDNVDYSVTSSIFVEQNIRQNVSSFMANDGSRYIMALIKPNEPIIGINDMTVGLYKMENMMSFPEVSGYSILLDPRMPGMGNHSSSNNTDLYFNLVDNLYHGDLSLTMTGYWVLNLKLVNELDEILKGEDVTDENSQSSLFLELEF